MITGNTSKAFPLLLVVGQFLGAPAQLVRYEKFDIISDVISAKNIKFPLTRNDAKLLRENSNSVSVLVQGDDCTDVDLNICENELEEKGLFPPCNPENKEFWIKFKEVVHVMSLLKNKDKTHA